MDIDYPILGLPPLFQALAGRAIGGDDLPRAPVCERLGHSAPMGLAQNAHWVLIVLTVPDLCWQHPHRRGR